ncbi:MAG: transporter, permease protein [Bacteroidetes bacterium]|nr:transporter, permease protein [Bacteroidota bacterium]
MRRKRKNNVNKQIASVHLTSKKWQTAVAILGVTFGVSMYIFMNSFMNGVNKAQDDLAFSNLAHIRIDNESEKRDYNPVSDKFPASTLFNIRDKKDIQSENDIKNTTEVMSVLKKQSEISNITAQLNFSVFFRSGSKKINGSISGVDVENENRMFGSASKVITGKWDDLNFQKSGLIIGKTLAENLGLKLNDNVNILTSDGISKNFSVIGIIETSVKEIDRSRAYININTARQVLGKNFDYSSDILVNLYDRNKTDQIVANTKSAIKYKMETWQEANQQLLAASQLRNIIAIAVSFAILLVAGFGIYNIMNMTINEKIREIAILKAMGFAGKDILNIFLTQASIIGLLGGATGLILGVGISSLVNRVPFKVAGLTTLPINYHTIDFMSAIVFGILTTIIAGYLPARKASKIDPVLIIRG